MCCVFPSKLTGWVGWIRLLACRVSKKEWVSLHVEEKAPANSSCNVGAARHTVRLDPIAYRLDSRLEVIIPRSSTPWGAAGGAPSSVPAAVAEAARDLGAAGAGPANDGVPAWAEEASRALSAHDWGLAEKLIMRCLLQPW